MSNHTAEAYPDSVRRNRAKAMAELVSRMCGLTPTDAICERCLYRAESWRDAGHCYMFRDRPNMCGQFRSASAERPQGSTGRDKKGKPS